MKMKHFNCVFEMSERYLNCTPHLFERFSATLGHKTPIQDKTELGFDAALFICIHFYLTDANWSSETMLFYLFLLVLNRCTDARRGEAVMFYEN